jgi:DNA-binding NarL/FixJ family response regulator
VAAELGMGRSSLATLMSASLRSIGLDPRLSRVPFVLAAMAHVAQSATERSAPCTMLEWSIALPRPEAAVSECLTVSERGVVQLLAEGSNGSDIARLRGTTRRTVANQSSVLFRKLNVSGRLELFACLWRCAQARALAPLTATPSVPSPSAAAHRW